MKWLDRLLGRKEFTFTPLNLTGSWSSTLLPRTKFDYAAQVGDGLGSSVLMSPIKWVQRNFNDAPLQILDLSGSEPKEVMEHPMVAKIRRPNPYYTGSALWAGALYSFIFEGDGYWIKVRKKRGQTPWYDNVSSEVEQLLYIPHWIMEPRGPSDNSLLISHYRYTPGGEVIDIAPENVIHFRNNIDPRNPRKGMSMIYSELREIFTDDEAANFAATLLRNMGVPGMVVSPDGSVGQVAIENAEEMKKVLKASLSGEKRGEPMVSSIPLKVDQFKIDQNGIDFSSIRNTPEERICAAIGISAPVVGFGAGLDTTKVGATMSEFKRMSWENGIIPLHGAMDEQLTIDLLPEFDAQAESRKVTRNYKVVAALQENQKDVVERAAALVKGSIAMISEARAMCGLDVDESQNVYLRPIGTVAVSEDGKIQQVPKPTPAPTPAKGTKAATTDAEQQFGDTLDSLETEGAAAIAGQFDEERRAVVRALRKK